MSCDKDAKMGRIQPHGVCECLHDLRAVWASAILDGAPIPPTVFQTPFRKSHPLIEALLFSLACQRGKVWPPLSQVAPIMPFGELCQFALLTQNKALAQTLLPLTRFPSLWCPEKAYHAQENQWSIALLLRAFGKSLPFSSCRDPFFLALAKQVPQWDDPDSSAYDASANSQNLTGGATVTCRGKLEVAITTVGEKIPLGALRAEGIEIPAFGPQAYPLNDPDRFGVRRTLPDTGWISVAALPEVWFHVNLDLDRGGIETRFVGLTPALPCAFAFYIKAGHATIDNQVFRPQNLHRYIGETKKVHFTGENDSRLTIDAESVVKMELIPLAGEGCFWDAQFLLAYEIPSLEGRSFFKMLAV